MWLAEKQQGGLRVRLAWAPLLALPRLWGLGQDPCIFQLHSLHLWCWKNRPYSAGLSLNAVTVDQGSFFSTPLSTLSFCTSSTPNCFSVLCVYLVPQLTGEHFISHLQTQTTDQEFSLSCVPASILVRFSGYSNAFHPPTFHKHE